MQTAACPSVQRRGGGTGTAGRVRGQLFFVTVTLPPSVEGGPLDFGGWGGGGAGANPSAVMDTREVAGEGGAPGAGGRAAAGVRPLWGARGRAAAARLVAADALAGVDGGPRQRRAARGRA